MNTNHTPYQIGVAVPHTPTTGHISYTETWETTVKTDPAGLTMLGLPHDLENTLREALTNDTTHTLEAAIATRINAALAEHGVNSNGRWLGDWDPADIITEELTRHTN